MPVKSKAQVFDPGYMIQPGMNKKLMKKDAVEFEPNNMVKFSGLGDDGGPQVGPGADADAMGEDSHARITYPSGGGSKAKK